MEGTKRQIKRISISKHLRIRSGIRTLFRILKKIEMQTKITKHTRIAENPNDDEVLNFTELKRDSNIAISSTVECDSVTE